MNISELLTLAIQRGASDLHLSAGLPPLLRIDGDLQCLDFPVFDHATVLNLLQEIMTEKQCDEFSKQFEIDFAFHIPELTRVRVNVFNQQRGVAGVLRVIPNHVPDLEELNLPKTLQEITGLTNGLVLITGPTGSGKSTTLAAMVNAINQQQAKHIITIEDPIEFLHASKKCLINQREVQRDTLNFSAALRAALREDPDIILVGELRDLETIRLALTAAETGHLVFATLHTTSAPKTIHRIIDVFPGEEKLMIRALLAESLQAVVCQTLVKKINGGRVAALEILRATPAIRNLIREDKIAQIYSAMQTGAAQGMQTLDQHRRELHQQNLITFS
jgi:twitching motility protein PilT